MGLDNYFRIQGKQENRSINLAHFRKFYELDEWFMSHAPHIGNYEVQVTSEVLDKLQAEIDPVVDVLNKIGQSKIDFYEEHGYPKKYYIQFFGKTFNPTDSVSIYVGEELCRLKGVIDVIREILRLNDPDEISVTFYSSF